jgi:hypothetical protein
LPAELIFNSFGVFQVVKVRALMLAANDVSNVQYLFYRCWDDELDDYEVEYEVFILPNLSEDEIKKSWSLALEKGSPFGKIPVKQVVFDSTYRLTVDTVTFDKIITR